MPLSKARNRERMRKTRLHKRLLPLTEWKPVQPDYIKDRECGRLVDADGNPIPELT